MGTTFPGSYSVIADSLNNLTLNTFNGTLQIFRLPGSQFVSDRKGGLVSCDHDHDSCPFYSLLKRPDGSVLKLNHAPFLAEIGWSGMVRASASAADQDLVYSFFVWLASPEVSLRLCTQPGLINIFRHSHFFAYQNWTQEPALFGGSQLTQFFTETSWALTNQNAALDLSVPGRSEYNIQFTDLVVEAAFHSNLTLEDLCEKIRTAWESITESRGGARVQLDVYLGSLSLPPKEYPTETFTIYLFLIIVVLGVLFILALSFYVSMRRRVTKKRKDVKIAKVSDDVVSGLSIAIGQFLFAISLEAVDIGADYGACLSLFLYPDYRTELYFYMIVTAFSTATSIASIFVMFKDIKTVYRQRQGFLKLDQTMQLQQAELLTRDNPLYRLNTASRHLRATQLCFFLLITEDIPFFCLNFEIMARHTANNEAIDFSIWFAMIFNCLNLGRKVEKCFRYKEIRTTKLNLTYYLQESTVKDVIDKVDKIAAEDDDFSAIIFRGHSHTIANVATNLDLVPVDEVEMRSKQNAGKNDN
jgi:hypothetical protein